VSGSSLAIPEPALSASADDLDPTDTELVAAAAGGDRQAFAELYRRHVAVVNAAVLSRVPPADAPDLVQEVFVAALRRIDTVREPDRFAGFLVGISRRLSAGYWRSKRPSETLDETVGHRGRVETATLTQQVLARIRQLPEAYRVPLILRLVEDMTGPEIASRTGLTPGSVRVNLHRGMKLLRQSLATENDDEQ
jgi:RNA polymerase sigma-70 factor (ECF subfamily)